MYQRCPSYPDQVAVMTQIMPSFEVKSKKTKTVFVEEEELDESDSKFEDKYTYIFIVDRSGSMGGTRMDITKEAMRLFMQSLPAGSSFAIISFGSDHRTSGVKQYSPSTLDLAINEISGMSADMGGTEIYNPIAYAFRNLKTKLKKRVFLLTDGSVSQPDRVI